MIDPAKLSYIVVNHREMDHSAHLPELIDFVQPEKIFCFPIGKIDVIKAGQKIKYVPDKEKLETCRAMGRRISKAICESINQ